MKILKFTSNLVPKIISGEKTTTWRLFDDKDLKEGDEATFINKETGEEFGKAKLVSVQVKIIKDLTLKDLNDHEYDSLEDMIKSHKKYYGDKVDENSEVKIISFNFTKSNLL